ncbi:MAG: hypothetical protein AAF318_09380 [Pseudomonadota bacterium]
MRVGLVLAAALVTTHAAAFEPTGFPEADALLAAIERDGEQVTGVGTVRQVAGNIILTDVVTEAPGTPAHSCVVGSLSLTAPRLVDGVLHADRLSAANVRIALGRELTEIARTTAHDVRLSPGVLSIKAPIVEGLRAFGAFTIHNMRTTGDGATLSIALATFTPDAQHGDGLLGGKLVLSEITARAPGPGDPFAGLAIAPAQVTLQFAWDETGVLEMPLVTLDLPGLVSAHGSATLSGLTPESDFQLTHPAPDNPPALQTVLLRGATLTLSNVGIGDAVSAAMGRAMGLPRDVARMIQQQAIAGALFAIEDETLRESFALATATMLASGPGRVILTLAPDAPTPLATVNAALSGDDAALRALGLTVATTP